MARFHARSALFCTLLAVSAVLLFAKEAQASDVTTPCSSSTISGSTCAFNGLTYSVVTAKDGRQWLDRNLGATRVATAYNDQDSYGWYYQWGRGTDGHQLPNSGINTTLSISDNPGHGNFIPHLNYPYDWLSPQNDTLWQGINGVNNPCPEGFRLPTQPEWQNLFTVEVITNNATAFASTLKLASAGQRNGWVTGNISEKGMGAFYWSSTTYDGLSLNLALTSNSINMASKSCRVFGLSVRCIKEPVSTLTITVSPESKTSHHTFIPVSFSVKTSLFSKRNENGSLNNKMRVELDNRMPVTIRYDREEEDANGTQYATWEGVYNKPKGNSTEPFHITGALEMANCAKDTGEKIPFDIQQESRGVYTIRKTVRDGELVTQTDFTPAEPPPAQLAQCPSFWQKPLSSLLCHLFGFYSKEPPRAEIQTTTTYTSIDDDDNTLTEARARKICGRTETFTCGVSSVTDSENNVYGTVQVGTQCWMDRNMNVGSQTNIIFDQTNNNIIEKYCYNNNGSYCGTYGGLYQWNEAMQYSTTEGTQGICPVGFHIPTIGEWYTLENSLKYSEQTCDASDWKESCLGAGANLIQGGSSGLNLPLAGSYSSYYGFINLNNAANFWSSTGTPGNGTQQTVSSTRIFRLGVAPKYVEAPFFNMSIRCIKD